MEILAVVLGIGLLITAVGEVKARAWNAVLGGRVRFVDVAVPFVQRWALYSAAVGVTIAVQYGLLSAL